VGANVGGRDESGNGKIPYRPTPNPVLADRVPFLQEKQENRKKNRKSAGTGTGTGEAVSRPYSRFPYLSRKNPAGIPVYMSSKPHF
jgi:hypothetical protein